MTGKDIEGHLGFVQISSKWGHFVENSEFCREPPYDVIAMVIPPHVMSMSHLPSTFITRREKNVHVIFSRTCGNPPKTTSLSQHTHVIFLHEAHGEFSWRDVCPKQLMSPRPSSTVELRSTCLSLKDFSPARGASLHPWTPPPRGASLHLCPGSFAPLYPPPTTPVELPLHQRASLSPPESFALSP